MLGGEFGVGHYYLKYHRMDLPRIILVIPSLTLGGAERQAMQLARLIRDANIGIPVVVGIGRPGELQTELEKENIEHHSLQLSIGYHQNRTTLWKRAFTGRAELRALKPSLLLPFTYWPNVLSSFSSIGLWRIPCLWNQRSVDLGLPYSTLERVSRWGARNYAANSRAAANCISERHNLISKDTVNIIPNLIAENFKGVNKREKDHGATARMLMMANFFPGKRQDLVLQGLKSWEETQPEQAIELVFSGKAPGGYFLEIIKAQAFDLNLKSKVRFCRYSSLTEALLEGVDVGLLATDSEGYSNSIMEYMLAGLPVLVSDIPSNREVLGEQTEHQLFGPTAAEFAQALQNLMDKKQNWDEMGKANREEILSRHSITAEEKWIQAIKKCLK